jgi:ankyrin repeat protein
MNEQTQTLPARPSLEQLRNQAKDLKKSGPFPTLSDAQLALAQSYGFASWPKMKEAVDLRTLKNLIQDGDPEPVCEFLADEPQLLNARFEEGETPLLCAAEENRPEIVELLVGLGADMRLAYEGSSHTALSWAVTCFSAEAALKLIELGDKPDLFCAAGLGLLGHVKTFWPDGKLVANPSQTGSSRVDNDGKALPRPPQDPLEQVCDALYIACRNGHIETARWLLDHGADPDFRGYTGASCLAWADFSGNAELLALLESRGASNDVRDQQYGVRPREFGIMVLAGWGFGWKCVERLKSDPSLVHLQTAFGTPLHAAANGGHSWIAQTLLQLGADKNAVDPKGKTAAQVAAAKGHRELAALLE